MTRERRSALLTRIGRPAQLQPFRERNFRYLWAGFAVSLLGDGMMFVALPWLVLSLSDTTTALAAIGVVMAVTALPAAILAGTWVNRYGARRVMLAGDLLRAGILASIGLLSLTDSLPTWYLYVGLAVFSAAEAAFVPAFNTMVQSLVRAEHLVGANSVDQIIRPLMWRLIGPALGGALVARSGADWVFVADALTFVVSFGFLLGVGAERGPLEQQEPGSLLAQSVDGFRYMWRQKWLLYAFAAGAVTVICVMGPWNVLVPFILHGDAAHGAETYGLVLAVGGVGQIGGAILVGGRSLDRWTLLWLYLAWGAMAGGLVGFAFDASLVPALIGSFVINAALAVSAVLWGALLQSAVSRAYVARMFGIDWALSQVLVPISYSLTGAFAGITSTGTTLLVAAVGGLICVPAVLVVRQARHIPEMRNP
ncbi:MFS transporter [Streptomyces sp. TS71-3]|uniref:MFS transporter n=1 Tax=Streptomyces sp. TS71-3 TaxID=2733862 RepID=UPI001B05BFBF|nr:MFS transporter [Streptomyces sp. TS71-3]GHJ37182.1 MFS transporter [Streptomyces sp. TS71-3]